MARPIVLGNGELHVGINRFGLVHDFYYPHVGLENHAAAHNLRHRIGVWSGGTFSWLDDGTWEFTYDYPHRALIGRIKATNVALGIILEFDDCVDVNQALFMRNIHVINSRDHERVIKVYFHQVFAISGASNNGDTVQYLPSQPAILHYKGHRNFVVSAKNSGTGEFFNQYSVGIFGLEGKEGTYRDAEDGYLSGNNVEHGTVDSVIGFEMNLGAHDSGRLEYWIAAGKSLREALVIHERIEKDGALHYLLRTDNWWREWLEPAEKCIARLTPRYQAVFRKSLMIIKSHIDKHGAVIASTDTTMLNYSRDAYAYCWPRDAAFILWPLIRLGYKDEALQFFNFCRRALHTDGYLMHKYQADGALGSSWHPYLHEDGSVSPPIQEDETAIVLFLIGEYFDINPDERKLKDYFTSLIEPMANFLAEYIEPTTKLPKPSYDLWESTYHISTYSTAAVYAALLTASRLADQIGNNELAVKWQVAAEEIKQAAGRYLFSNSRQYFVKGLYIRDEQIDYDQTVDTSSFYGSFMFGLFDKDGPEMKASFNTLTNVFGLDSENVRGLPRFEHDQYNIADPASLGNPWFITTLWMAQYHLESNQIAEGKAYIDWVVDRAMSSGVLSEQINPYSGRFISVAPLAWSQAELVNSLIDTVIDTGTSDINKEPTDETKN